MRQTKPIARAVKKRKVRGVFVTGTDTGVGKTVAASVLAAWAHASGRDVGVMKPIATGANDRDASGELISDDARLLAQACGSREAFAWITPACFKEPLAPLTAARRASKTISLRLIRRAFSFIASRHSTVIVEGVGGLLVPITERLMVVDLARSLGLPIVIVARTRLGTLNHTLMTLACARAARLTIAGVICVQSEPAGKDPMDRVAQKTNPQLIRRLGKVPLLGVLPYDPAAHSADPTRRVAALRRLSRHLDTRVLARWL